MWGQTLCPICTGARVIDNKVWTAFCMILCQNPQEKCFLSYIIILLHLISCAEIKRKGDKNSFPVSKASMKGQFVFGNSAYRFIETKEVRRENPKKKKPKKGRYQHKEPPCYRKQITNLSTKPKQVAKSTLETLTMLRSECHLDQSLQLQRMEAFKIDLLNFV